MSTWVGTGPVGLPSLLGSLRRPVGPHPVGPRRVDRRTAGRRADGRAGGLRSATPALRLTRRGRLAVGVLLLLVLVSCALVGRLSLASAAGTPTGTAGDAVLGSARGGADGVVPAPAPGTTVGRSSGSQVAELAVAGRVGVPAGWAVVTAAPGDSLWSLARRTLPAAEPRDTVQRIVERNGLIGTEIAAGDALLVPVS